MKFAFKGRLALSIALSFLMMFAPLAFSAPTEVKKISAQSINAMVRIEMQLSQSVKYHYFFLQNPERLVVDLENTNPISIAFPSFANEPWIKHIRAAVHATHTQRIVFELAESVKAKLVLSDFSKTDGWRLMIDLQPPANAIVPAPKKILPTTLTHVAQTAAEHQAVARCINVVIDPGHGGSDPGATGPHGIKEKNVTLAISKYLSDLINHTPGMCAYMTRESDYFVSLRGRLELARKKSADIFIAIHADIFRDKSARGATVFALSQRGATSEAARWIAHSENVSNLLDIGATESKDKDLQSILMDISQNETINRSLILGKDVLLNLDDVSKLHHVIVEQAGFVVLKSPDIPSILVETGFLSNAYEESQLAQSAYQKKIALAIYRGVTEYFRQYSPPDTKAK